MKKVLPFLETMITYSCNLSCTGCTNYSDYTMKGYVSWEQGKTWLSNWLDRVDIPDFGIIGGEPLLCPDVNKWIVGCRELMPDTQIRFTTNASLLTKKLSVFENLLDIGNSVIKISVHQPSEYYVQEALHYVFKSVKWTPVEEHGIKRWLGPKNVRLQINFPKTFIKSYKNKYHDMMPHNSLPSQAFDICVQKTCPLLYNEKLYKCSTSALLKKVLQDWNRTEVIAWQPYLEYNGIDIHCNDSDLSNFIKGFGKPEQICRMCPSVKDTESNLIHIDNVIAKSEKKEFNGKTTIN